MNLLRPALGVCGAALLAVSCAPRSTSSETNLSNEVTVTTSSTPGAYIRTPAEAGAGVSMEGPAVLELDGGNTDVSLKTDWKGSDMILTAHLHGQETDREVYSVGDEAFLLKMAAGETYEPPIPLLTFPMNVGDSWEWRGKLLDAEQPASATITTEASKVVIEGANLPAIQCRVELKIEGKNAPARRELTFWLVEGKGVVRREFGDISKRRPKED